MAKLTWTITTSAGSVSQDGPVISEANMTRFRDWLWAWYPQYEADGETLKTRNAANEAQAFRDWADAQWEAAKNKVLHWERQAAEQTARDAVTDITS